ncbi:hypothetical protein FKP32DRAFT_437805 [Trametes sanguinea]|nr:hypothetical protein FKP32DRAFT_437805 [Trametes sanguinea]
MSARTSVKNVHFERTFDFRHGFLFTPRTRSQKAALALSSSLQTYQHHQTGFFSSRPLPCHRINPRCGQLEASCDDDEFDLQRCYSERYAGGTRYTGAYSQPCIVSLISLRSKYPAELICSPR